MLVDGHEWLSESIYVTTTMTFNKLISIWSLYIVDSISPEYNSINGLLHSITVNMNIKLDTR